MSVTCAPCSTQEMEKSLMETSIQTAEVPIPSTEETQKTPPPRNHQQPIESQLNSPISSVGSHRIGIPDRLKVPKPFKYPERYTSPTDSMMSPVSKRLLSKSRKPAPLLPPTSNQHHHHKKIQTQESRFNDLGLLQS